MIDLGKAQRKATSFKAVGIDQYIAEQSDLVIVDGFRWKETQYGTKPLFHTQTGYWFWGAGYSIEQLVKQFKGYEEEEIDSAFRNCPQLWRLNPITYLQKKGKKVPYRPTEFLGNAAELALLEAEMIKNVGSDGTETATAGGNGAETSNS